MGSGRTGAYLSGVAPRTRAFSLPAGRRFKNTSATVVRDHRTRPATRAEHRRRSRRARARSRGRRQRAVWRGRPGTQAGTIADDGCSRSSHGPPNSAGDESRTPTVRARRAGPRSGGRPGQGAAASSMFVRDHRTHRRTRAAMRAERRRPARRARALSGPRGGPGKTVGRDAYFNLRAARTVRR
jgi:hypothetical protein